MPPYESSIEGCPDWVTLFPDQGILAGIAVSVDAIGRSFFCTYRVTESDPGFRLRRSVTYGLRLTVVYSDAVTGTLMLPESVVPGNVIRLRVGERARITFRPATGGGQPYTYELPCPDPPPGTFPLPSELPPGLGFGPLTRFLSGTPEVRHTGPDCTYSVTDSATPPATLARSVALIIDPTRAKWRFTQRTLLQEDRPLNRNNDADPQLVYKLALAEPEHGETPPDGTDPVYRLLGIGPPLAFDPGPDTREPGYVHRSSDPPLGKTTTHRYQVLFGDTVDDTLCIDVSYRDEHEDDYDDRLIASVRIHDDAYFDGTEFRCPPVPLRPASASCATPSNPVHAALAPVHARRALDVAHGAVRERVRGWTPGAARVLTAIAPLVGLGSPSGESEGFDYTGSNESLSTGAELGARSWQAGLVGSHTRAELHYRARASLAGRGYLTGEHDTEIFSVHPFAAWHRPSGGRAWTPLGAGTGHLRHRDDLGFPSWSRSNVNLRAYAAGDTVPMADLLAGELEAEAGIEAFAFEIEGGQLEAKASVSAEGMFDPRVTLIGSAQDSFGVDEYEHDSWGLSGGVRFISGEVRRGFGLELDTRLVSRTKEARPMVGMRGEAGYGLSSGPLFGTLRPHVGLIRYSGDGSLQRGLGVALRDTPRSRIKLEVYDRTRDGLRALQLTLDHRF